jgi:hypothetical protein
MGYVIAAYAVSIGAVGLYFIHLLRERQSLRRDLDPGAAGAASGTFRN